MKFFLALLLLDITQAAIAANALSYEATPPAQEVLQRKSITGPVTASILVTVITDPDPNLFEPGEVYLKIEDDSGVWWVHTQHDSMDIVQFIGTRHLLITISTPASTATAVLDLEDKSLILIGSGTGELLTSSPDDPRIHLTGRKGYANGAFWYQSITDLQGRVIEYLPGGTDCLPVSEILLSNNDDISRLNQPLDFCVGVVR